jgi:hypothetical protein
MGREHFRIFPLVHMRVDLGLNKAFKGLLDFQMFMGELHGATL